MFRNCISRRVFALAAIAGLSLNAHAMPEAANGTFNDNIAEPGSIVFNVHEAGLVTGTPLPIYVIDSFNTSNGPPSLRAERVGNACIRIEWGNDNSAAEPWSVGYSLIAGDRTQSAQAEIRFQNGTRDLTPVVDTANGCDDTENQAPVTGPANFEFASLAVPLVLPIISSDGPATDFDGISTLRFTDLSCFVQPQNGTISVNFENPRSLIFTPNTGWPGGSDSFEYCVTDNPFGSATGVRGTATFTVGTSAVAIDAVDDTANARFAETIAIDVLANDALPAGTTITAVSDSAAGSFAIIQDAFVCSQDLPGITTQCVFYDAPSVDANNNPFSGIDTFTYTITDEAGNADTATVTVTVEGDNSNPMRALLADAATTPVEQAVVVDVLSNDTLISGDQLVAVSASTSGGNVEILDAATCVTFDDDFFQDCVRYTPPATTTGGVVFAGQDSFTYTVGVSGDTSTATVTITVEAPNGSPQPVADDETEVESGASVEIDVLANDIDDGGVENLTIVSVTEPANGTAVINQQSSGDTITYTPNTGFIGTDTFFYTVSDGDVNTIDQAAQVTVTVGTPGGRRSLSSLALTPEELELASAIDTVCARLNASETSPGETENESGTAQLASRCNALIDFANPIDGSDNTDEVRDALRQIAGEEVFAQSTLSTQILNTQTQNIDARLAALRGGARGINAQGLALNVQGKTLPRGLLASRAVEEEENALLADSRWGMFINGRLNFGDQGATTTENGFDFETLGVTAGVDYRFRNDFALGAAIGFANADADYNGSSGTLDSDSLTYSVYGTYFTDRFYVDMLALFGGIDFDTERTLNFMDALGGVDTTALGQTDGDQRVFSANFGYNIDRDGWLFVPFIGYDYLDTNIDAYRETQGRGWELAFDEQSVQSQIWSAGLRMSYTHSASWGVLVPHLRLASQHEMEDDLRVITARFANDPGATRFRFFTDAPDSSFFQLAAGVSLVMENGVSAYVDYETLTGYNNLESSTLTLGVRFERRFK